MRAFRYLICSALAVATTSSLAQSDASPVDNGFFRPVTAVAPTPPPGEAAPLTPAPPVATPEAPVNVAAPPPEAPTPEMRREQERRAAVWALEKQRMESDQQNALARRNANPASVAPPAR